MWSQPQPDRHLCSALPHRGAQLPAKTRLLLLLRGYHVSTLLPLQGGPPAWNGEDRMDWKTSSNSLNTNCVLRSFVLPKFLSQHSTNFTSPPAKFVSENC